MLSFFVIISKWAIPALILIVLGMGYYKKVPIYEVFIQGAMEGLKTTLKLTPYLLAIFVAIGIFRTSGALPQLILWLHPLLNLLHIPPDLVTLGILKPLSGSASLGITADLLHKYGPDSTVGFMASLAQGSGETTFYIFSLYLGVIQTKNTRHILPMGLASEIFAFILAIYIGTLMTK